MKSIKISEPKRSNWLHPKTQVVSTVQVHICSISELSALVQEGKIDTKHSFAIVVAGPAALLEFGETLKAMQNIAAEYLDPYHNFPLKDITPETAKLIAGSLTSRKEIRYWYFVSERGVQISPAIACAALYYWGLEKEELSIWRDPTKWPTDLVYVRMCRALGVHLSNRALSKRLDMNKAAIQSATHHPGNRYFNLLLVFNSERDKILMCKRSKPPYQGLLNLVGGKVQLDEDRLDAAYRELEEETNISRDNIHLTYLMDMTYYQDNCVLEIFAGRLKEDVPVSGTENPLVWIPIQELKIFDDWLAGDGNVKHIVEYTMRLIEEKKLDI